MIGWSIVYIIIAVITTLSVSAYRGNQWGAGRCVMFGVFWIIALPLMGFTLALDKIMNGGTK